ncbi:hypothetical protein [Paenibacillus humicus]|uniref:hypothetical protein n=1 Tax=Paenibacillus humicus TaxID=412861 RepID=UPI001C3F5087|nr:hypothetical protein [Paenibacillus humicus]
MNAVGLLGVVFITLKLTGVIDWSWWWVTLPFWGGPAILAILATIISIAYVATAATSKARRRHR